MLEKETEVLKGIRLVIDVLLTLSTDTLRNELCVNKS